jgi:hypothetical protein
MIQERPLPLHFFAHEEIVKKDADYVNRQKRVRA